MSRYADSDDSCWWERGQLCATPGCEHFVTFPDMEAHCSDCLLKREQVKVHNEEIYTRAIRSFFQRTEQAS